MRFTLLKIDFNLRTLMRDNGQDLVEYALLTGLLVFAATAGFNSFAAHLSNAFSNMGSVISSSLS